MAWIDLLQVEEGESSQTDHDAKEQTKPWLCWDPTLLVEHVTSEEVGPSNLNSHI